MKSRVLQTVLVIFLIGMIFQTADAQKKQPKTVRDYFMLLPQSYFAIESCNTDIVKNCRPFKIEYLNRFLKVEDTPNGYLEGGGDGSQEHFKMALFKRPNGSYIIGLNVFGEWGETYNFLDYHNGKWFDVSKSVIPKYKKSNIYELPRKGTTISVYARKIFNSEDNLGERSSKLYDLIWKNGKFQIKK